jgi:hypothetical protein
MMGRMVVEASHSLPTDVFPSTSRKCTSLVKVVTADISVNRMARWWEGNIGNYAGGGSTRA